MIETNTIEWKSQYELGNFEIDSEHKIFIKIIQKIIDANKEDAGNKYMEGLVNELLKYADFHFCSEENLMISINYPDYEIHRKKHLELLLQLKDEVHTINAKYIDFDALIKLLTNWFLNHTTTEDKKLTTYINQTSL